MGATATPASVRVRYGYSYNGLRQVVAKQQSGTVFADLGPATTMLYEYNERGELRTAAGFSGSDMQDQSSPLPGRRFEYGYDAIGNRRWANHTGVDTLRDDFTTNALNQYVTRENSKRRLECLVGVA